MRLTIVEFRKQMREAFDAALRGEKVEVTRHGKIFLVMHNTFAGKFETGLDMAIGKDQSVETPFEVKPGNVREIKKSRLPSATNEFSNAKVAGYSGKDWNEGAKHHLNVPQTTAGEKPCCSLQKPCQHWSFDGASEKWVNSLSGRERSAE